MLTRRAALQATGTVFAVGMPATPPGSDPDALARGTVLNAGRHAVGSNMTVRGDLMLLPGATIDVAAGRTLTIAGDFVAPRAHVFVGGGLVDMNASRATEAYPEWWGAVADDEHVDSLPALQACVAAHPVTRLIEGRYHTTDTWRISLANRRVWGTSASPLGRPRCTEIALADATKDVILVGLADNPGHADRFPEGIDVRFLRATRTVPVEPPAAGREGDAPTGVRMQFVLRGTLEDVASTESSIGFVVRGTARSFVRRCEVLRTRPGSRRENDIFWGFFFDGDVRIGFAGGNASVYVSDCFAKVEERPPLAGSIGAHLRGAFCDTFLINFEVADMDRGIVATGSAADPDRGRQKTGNADLHIFMPVLDGLSAAGIEISQTSDYALIEITDPYVAVTSTALAAIIFQQCRGQTTVSGGQLLGPGGASIGVHVVDAEGIALRGTKIREFGRPVGFTRGRDFEIDVAISNPEAAGTQGAVWLAGCDRGFVRARVKGRAGAFPQGVFLMGADNHHLAIEVTGIDPGCVQGGSANVLQVDGRQVTAAGRFGDNLATGVFG